MSYWKFFPAEGDWGRIPVWGVAEVATSEHQDLKQGQRVFGYFPMSEHLVVAPARINERGFVDASPHRAELPGAYNRYMLEGDPRYDTDHEDEQMLLTPLFFTSFLVDDFLDDNGFFGGNIVVLERFQPHGDLARLPARPAGRDRDRRPHLAWEL